MARSQRGVFGITEACRHIFLQALYSYTTTSSAANAPADRPAAAAALSMVPELHVEGFDAEQIWLQLDMASAQLVRRAKRLLKKAGADPSLLTPETEEDLSGQHAASFSVQLLPLEVLSHVSLHRCASATHTHTLSTLRQAAIALLCPASGACVTPIRHVCMTVFLLANSYPEASQVGSITDVNSSAAACLPLFRVFLTNVRVHNPCKS